MGIFPVVDLDGNSAPSGRDNKLWQSWMSSAKVVGRLRSLSNPFHPLPASDSLLPAFDSLLPASDCLLPASVSLLPVSVSLAPPERVSCSRVSCWPWKPLKGVEGSEDEAKGG